MKFRNTDFQDVYIIDLEKIEDERGFFARAWDSAKFNELNLDSNIVQSNIVFTKKKGTIRGLHYQIPPFEESKLIRCTKGKIYDVILDLRPNSVTFKKWLGMQLSADRYEMIYVPKGFAHGYQSLEDDIEVFYHTTQSYSPNAEKGIRWDDPAFKIKWPLKASIISQKDSSWEMYKE